MAEVVEPVERGYYHQYKGNPKWYYTSLETHRKLKLLYEFAYPNPYQIPSTARYDRPETGEVVGGPDEPYC